ncbi:hypothetical protein JQN72_07950 [Phycicoccus sp. CSK15P-2]|uniref:hypothetical protein n=1 Tax=Phycicoccus sp. CSK15P-2 TaxID=2807627 RepID=UPI00194EF7B1|nr:hypothetical protein [Phycicoccus sp. CSK15P-2]MBM6404175.1 hypothetical protein [Phycicoccus sp. CSK15P-2]
MRIDSEWRTRRVAPALAATALLLGGCSGTGASGALATYDAGASNDDAMLTGTLSITDECVTVDDGSAVTTPAFVGASLSDGVLRYRGAEFADGARIELGGGETDDRAVVDLPRGCPSEHVFLVAHD